MTSGLFPFIVFSLFLVIYFLFLVVLFSYYLLLIINILINVASNESTNFSIQLIIIYEEGYIIIIIVNILNSGLLLVFVITQKVRYKVFIGCLQSLFLWKPSYVLADNNSSRFQVKHTPTLILLLCL